MIDSQLADAAADGFRVAEMAEGNAVDAFEDSRPGPLVSKRP
jgi:hypothetical protein